MLSWLSNTANNDVAPTPRVAASASPAIGTIRERGMPLLSAQARWTPPTPAAARSFAAADAAFVIATRFPCQSGQYPGPPRSGPTGGTPPQAGGSEVDSRVRRATPATTARVPSASVRLGTWASRANPVTPAVTG